MTEWKDVTSYSRGKEHIPTCWSLNVADLRLTIVKGHIYHPGKWVMLCEPWFNASEIGEEDWSAEDIQKIALNNLREKVEATFLALNRLES